MDESVLAAKGVHAMESTVAYVDGFCLYIGQRATLLPEPRSRAHGVLMEIAPPDAAALYSDPSVADYVAEPVIVQIPGGTRVPAVAYILPALRLSGTNPGYASALLALATRLGLPDDYLAHIDSFVAQ